jgi:hypothetical protein
MISAAILRNTLERSEVWDPFYQRSPQDPQNFYYLREPFIVQVSFTNSLEYDGFNPSYV